MTIVSSQSKLGYHFTWLSCASYQQKCVYNETTTVVNKIVTEQVYQLFAAFSFSLFAFYMLRFVFSVLYFVFRLCLNSPNLSGVKAMFLFLSHFVSPTCFAL